MTRNLLVNPVPGSTTNWNSNNGSKWSPSYANGEITVTVTASNVESTLASFYAMGSLGGGQFTTQVGLNYQREFEVWCDVPAFVKPVGSGGFVGGQQIPPNTWTRVVEQFVGPGQASGWPKHAMGHTLAPVDGLIPTPGPHTRYRRAMLAENPSGVTIPYGDGTTVGWHWCGPAHNSYSWGETWPPNLVNGLPGAWVRAANGSDKLVERVYLGGQQLNTWQRGTRRNGIPNPRMNPGASSPFTPLYTFANFGTGGAGNRAGVSGLTNMPEGLTSCHRQTWTTASTQGGYGGWSYSPSSFGMPNIAGSWVRMGLWCRPSAAHSINARLAMSRPSAAQLYVSSPTIQCLGNVWQWHQTPKYYVVPDVEVTTVLPFAYIPTEPITVGESLGVTGGVMEHRPTTCRSTTTPGPERRTRPTRQTCTTNGWVDNRTTVGGVGCAR
jgi:hypothetical protein